MPYGLVVVAYIKLKLAMQGRLSGDNALFTVPVYILSQAKLLLVYLRLLLFPFNQNIDYHAAPASGLDAVVLFAFALIALFVLLLFKYRKNRPAIAFFGGWFLMVHAPESSFFPIDDLLVEYRLYLSSAGLFALAAIGLAGFSDRRARYVVLVAVALVSCTLTFTRNALWTDGFALWADAANKSPGNARSLFNAGDALAGKGKFDAAIPWLVKAAAMPNSPYLMNLVYYRLGNCYRMTNDLNNAEKYALKVKALRNSDMRDDVYENLAEAYFVSGRYSDSARISKLQTQLSGSPQAHYNLAVSLMMLGRYPEARDQMATVLGLSLDNYEVRLNLSRIYQKLGDRANAVINAERAASTAADSAQAAEADGLLMELGGGR
ncbi:MAG TPA: tetratricopeptide repeat protein [Nitrospirota bacterium]